MSNRYSTLNDKGFIFKAYLGNTIKFLEGEYPTKTKIKLYILNRLVQLQKQKVDYESAKYQYYKDVLECNKKNRPLPKFPDSLQISEVLESIRINVNSIRYKYWYFEKL